eukprot:TRINITY_DN11196_c0_g1_i1.p1 TRINITY_DN11196_c0_g1~~TRINITY_DN11196_c0_g1_i1.p1  ORF type:complete len:618 (-),score=141.95 TRINITY_DN11196_c0_g1_i1:75-1850(-)
METQKKRLYTTLQKYVIEALDQNGGDVLTIDRTTGLIEEKPSGGQTAAGPSSQVEEIYGILGSVQLLSGSYLVVITEVESVGQILDNTVYVIRKTKILPFVDATLEGQEGKDEATYLAMMEKVLQTGYLYFSQYDLTNSVQRQASSAPVDQRFYWNQHLAAPFARLREKWITPIIMGFIEIKRNIVLNGSSFDYVIISRRSVLRAGTRYHRRGIDAAGNVANNVETEQIVISKNAPSEGSSSGSDIAISSYLQTRGSIPLFWEQSIDTSYAPKLALTQPTADFNACKRHFELQTQLYGSQMVVNLINHHGSESRLGTLYRKLVGDLNMPTVNYSEFDFHKEVGGSWEKLSAIYTKLGSRLDEFGFFSGKIDAKTNEIKTISQQKGVFRTNCIDNLDRTNVMQSIFARGILALQLRYLNIASINSEKDLGDSLSSMLRNIWADNADVMSNQYAGSGALKTDFTRIGKRTIAGIINDGVNSVQRYYFNNFRDGFRQDAYDLFLGNYRVAKDKASPFAGRHKPIASVVLVVLLVVLVVRSVLSYVGLERSGWGFGLLSVVAYVGVLGLAWRFFGKKKYGRKLVDLPLLSGNTNK